jgi:ABC-type multidrug transport system fused ATPase/permease subunit
VKPGQVVGFVGPSGAGKTTLVDTVLGLIAPDSGTIEVGGVRLDRIDMQAWRRKIGYVSQDTFLFHDTVANNIRWSAPDTPMRAVDAAGQAAGLSRLIEQLPRGYETMVGDRGAKLSGGQRQRISMARALLREPALLILDEATSSLDSLSEQDMVAVLNSLRGKMSVIVVAHRFTAVRNADFIYVLDQGRIVEQGTWDSLSGGRALFRKLMDAQAFDGQTEAESP